MSAKLDGLRPLLLLNPQMHWSITLAVDLGINGIKCRLIEWLE